MLSKAKIGAVIPVSDLERGIEFYGQTLGLGTPELDDMPENPGARFAIGAAVSSTSTRVSAQVRASTRSVRSRSTTSTGSRRAPRPRRGVRGVRHAGHEDDERDHGHGRGQGRLLQRSRRQHPRARAAGPGRRGRLTKNSGGAVPAWIAGGAVRRHGGDAAEVVVLGRPAADGPATLLEECEALLVDVRLGVEDTAGRVAPRCRNGLLDAPTPRRARPRAPRRAPCGYACRPRRRRRTRAVPAPSKARSGAVMLSMRSPGTSGPRTRSDSPSMLLSWRSRPGSQSPEPSPSVVVRTQTSPDASAVTMFVVWPSASGNAASASVSAMSRAAGPRPASCGSRARVGGTSESPPRVRTTPSRYPRLSGSRQTAS